jgi:hypothetical protein
MPKSLAQKLDRNVGLKKTAIFWRKLAKIGNLMITTLTPSKGDFADFSAQKI